MSYADQLRPWAIFERMPNGKNVCFYRFRTRPDADAYMSILRQGGGEFEVVFDRVGEAVLKDSESNCDRAFGVRSQTKKNQSKQVKNSTSL